MTEVFYLSYQNKIKNKKKIVVVGPTMSEGL